VGAVAREYDADGVTPSSLGGGLVSAANRWLTLLVVLLLVAAGLGAALAWRTHGDRADAATRQERYGDVLDAANAEVTAFVNLRYDRATETVDAVAAGATGEFRDHYVRSAPAVIRVLERNRSLMTGRVLWSGVSDVGPDRATVIVATTGTVSNIRTDGATRPREFRFRVALVREKGRWLTSDIDFVGDSR
jgi:Mce-associated membrane protein